MSLPGVWLPAVRVGTGVDVFTERLRDALRRRGLRAEIDWLPARAEWAPWSVARPVPPTWATVAHINSWLSPRFVPEGLPLITTCHHVVHEAAFAMGQSKAQRLYHRFHVRPIECANVARSGKVSVPSAYTASELRRALGWEEAVVIPHWVDCSVFRPPSHVRPGGSGRPFQLIYVGSRTRRKGFDLLPPIMRRLGKGFELLVTPNRGAPEAAESWPENMRTMPGSFPLPEQSLVSAYQQADALLLPSRLEGFGLVALEAMACGLPVIAARASALPEVVKDGETGLLVQPDDAEAFAAAARLLASDPQRHAEMRDAACRHVRDHFREMHAVDAYLALYASVLR